MSGLEVLTGLDRLTIAQCEELAKDIGYNTMTFDLVGPNGRLPCKWLDAYFGFFQIDGGDGFVMSKQFQYVSDVYCENCQLPEVAQ